MAWLCIFHWAALYRNDVRGWWLVGGSKLQHSVVDRAACIIRYGFSGDWCWIKTTTRFGRIWEFASFYAWLWLIIIAVCVMYTRYTHPHGPAAVAWLTQPCAAGGVVYMLQAGVAGVLHEEATQPAAVNDESTACATTGRRRGWEG